MSTVSASSSTTTDAIRDARNRRVTLIILGLMGLSGLSKSQLSEAVPAISRSVLYERLNVNAHSSWRSWELEELAAFFKVSPAVFYRDPAEVLAQNRKEKSTSDLRGLLRNEIAKTTGARAMLFPVPDL